MTEHDEEVRAGMTETEMRENLLSLVFRNDPGLYHAFQRTVESILPPDAAAVIRGSAVTGKRHKDDAPFDADQGRYLIGNTIAAVNALEIPEAEKDAIFSGNAKRLLKM